MASALVHDCSPFSSQSPNAGRQAQALTIIPAWLWDYLQREPVGQVVDES